MIKQTEKVQNGRGLILFLGIVLLTQAITSLIGGSLFMGPFSSHQMNHETLVEIASNESRAYISIGLQLLTGMVIVCLAIAIVRTTSHINKMMADIALYMYVLEVVLLMIGQVFIYGLLFVAKLYSQTNDVQLYAIGEVFLGCKEFAGSIAMIPFGIGAFLFYYLLVKGNILPKWLGLYGMITVVLVPVFIPLMAIGVSIPFVVVVPYVPFEFVAGVYVILRSNKIASRRNLVEI